MKLASDSNVKRLILSKRLPLKKINPLDKADSTILNIIEKLKTSDYEIDCLTVDAKNIIIKFIQENTLPDYEFNRTFSGVYSSNRFCREYYFRLRSIYIELFIKNIAINETFTSILIDKWNALDKNYVKKFKNDKMTRVFRENAIICTYALYIRANGNQFRLVKAINRFVQNYFKVPGSGYAPSKWRLSDFLLDVKGRFNNLEFFLTDDDREYYNNMTRYTPRYPMTINAFKKIFVQQVYTDPNFAESVFNSNFNKIARWIDNHVDNVKLGKRHLYGFKLSAPTVDSNGQMNPPIFFLYLDWLNKQYMGYAIKINTMVDINEWNKFIQTRMRDELGYTKFFRTIKKK